MRTGLCKDKTKKIKIIIDDDKDREMMKMNRVMKMMKKGRKK